MQYYQGRGEGLNVHKEGEKATPLHKGKWGVFQLAFQLHRPWNMGTTEGLPSCHQCTPRAAPSVTPVPLKDTHPRQSCWAKKKKAPPPDKTGSNFQVMLFQFGPLSFIYASCLWHTGNRISTWLIFGDSNLPPKIAVHLVGVSLLTLH